MTDNEITQKTIDLLDKIESAVRASCWVSGTIFSDRLEELKEDAQELRELIEVAEIDRAVKGIK